MNRRVPRIDDIEYEYITSPLILQAIHDIGETLAFDHGRNSDPVLALERTHSRGSFAGRNLDDFGEQRPRDIILQEDVPFCCDDTPDTISDEGLKVGSKA
jgi:hypothetical protein